MCNHRAKLVKCLYHHVCLCLASSNHTANGTAPVKENSSPTEAGNSRRVEELYDIPIGNSSSVTLSPFLCYYCHSHSPLSLSHNALA